ncbi:MAG: hypothetical protein HUU02_06610 [Bacteroidetes bacterium]|nr:hypothetical protein [Bacteroidota bacterium]
MNGSTDTKQQSLRSTWQFKFFLACVLVALIIVMRTFHIVPYNVGQQFYLTVMRHLPVAAEAGRVTVANGISEFSGRSLDAVGWTTYLKVFFALWLTFIIVPTGWIALRINSENRKAKGLPVPLLMRVGTVLCAVWCIAFTLSLTGSWFAVRSFFSTMQQDNTLARYRSDVTDHLSMISFTAQQYFIIPSTEGGEGDSFTKKNNPVTLPGLGFNEMTELGRTVLYSGGNDTTLHLLFIGNRLAEFDRADPSIGRAVTYEVMITPHRHLITMKQ